MHVALPLARPGIVAGLALVLMETISDFGTVDYFALETLTLGVFNVWLGMNSLSGASQISSVLFIFVLVKISASEIFGVIKVAFLINLFSKMFFKLGASYFFLNA